LILEGLHCVPVDPVAQLNGLNATYSSNQCCYPTCGSSGCNPPDNWCSQSTANCKGCSGTFCPGGSPTPPPAPPPSPAKGKLYCPQATDMNIDNGKANFHGNGWTIPNGGGRVSSKTSWNLLGGYMEFDMDTSNTKEKVNANFYTSSPSQPNCGGSCYCDGSAGAVSKCLEMDIIEANGHCCMASTPHTNQQRNCKGGTCGKGSGNCDAGGCQVRRTLPSSGKFHVKAAFATNGFMTVYIDGQPNANYSPMPDSTANAQVVTTMNSVGAVIESSMWTGWVPKTGACVDGSDKAALQSSTFSVSNVTVLGTVVQGSEPTKC